MRMEWRRFASGVEDLDAWLEDEDEDDDEDDDDDDLLSLPCDGSVCCPCGGCDGLARC